MLNREKRIQKVNSGKPFAVLENRMESLLHQIVKTGAVLPYYSAEGQQEGYWDELLNSVRQWAEEGFPDEPDGTFEPAQALLGVFVRNVYQITEPFNIRWNKLDEWYWKEILGIVSRPVFPGKIWFSFEKDSPLPQVLEKGSGFYQEDKYGNRSYYRLAHPLRVEGVEIASVSSLWYERNPDRMPAGYLNYVTAVRYQRMEQVTDGADMMFGESVDQVKALGILINHPSLLLREGKRTVSVLFFSENKEWLDELYRITGILQGHFNSWSQEKLLFEIFNSAFCLTLSTEEGWTDIQEYTIKIEDETLRIQFSLIESFPSTIACREEIHEMETPEPALCVYPNPDAWLYPYSWLSLFRLQKVVVRTHVENIRNLLLYNELGRIDNASPFQPFGTNTGKGAWIVVGNYEMARKSRVQMDMQIQWGELPEDETGLQGYYEGYGKGVTNRSFLLQASYLSDYNWYPTSNQNLFYLFSSIRTQPDGTPLPNAPLASVSHIYSIHADRMPPVKGTEEEYEYSIRSREGFMRFVLQEPAMGLGEKEYYRLFSLRMMELNRKKKQSELLNPPLYPFIERMSVDYRSEDVIDLRKQSGEVNPAIRQLYPLGQITTDSFLYKLDTDANLFIALQNVEGGELLSLFFNFQPVGKECSQDSLPRINWYWGNGYEWEEVSPETVTKDSTFNFMTSGVIKIQLPAVVRTEQYDKNGWFWLRAGIAQNAQAISRLCSLHLNAGLLIRESGNQPVEYIPDTSVKPEKKLPGISSLIPLTPLYDDYPEEDNTDLKIRVSGYISHRGSAVLPEDYEEITLQLFPDIGLVKCIPGFDGKEYRTGIVGLVIIPVISKAYEPYQPVATSYMLLHVREILLDYLSGYVKDLVVMNPTYVGILVRCGVTFYPDCPVSLEKSQLQSLINEWIAPWQKEGALPDIDRELSLPGLYKKILKETAVESVLYLTVIRIGKDGEIYDLYEYMHGREKQIKREPHVIYIPVKEHTIQVFSGEPEFGIEEMAVDDTMIIL